MISNAAGAKEREMVFVRRRRKQLFHATLFLVLGFIVLSSLRQELPLKFHDPTTVNLTVSPQGTLGGSTVKLESESENENISLTKSPRPQSTRSHPDNINPENAATITTTSTSPLHNIVMVHLGKTAGSTLTCMLGLGDSGKGDSNCLASDRIRPSKLADAVTERVHLEPAPVHTHDHFLLTLRNPVDRIVSWYYFVHPDFPPEILNRHKRGCQNYVQFYDCYRSIQDLTEDGLSSAKDDEPRNEEHRVCRSIARRQITGKLQCWHNAYNYNYTYGSLLVVGRQQRDAEPTAATDHDEDDSSIIPEQPVTMYAIRSEHLEHDWTTIDGLLGSGSQPQEDADTVRAAALVVPRKNDWNDQGPSVPNTTLSMTGRTNLCRVLCHEIQIYKELLHLAVNFNAHDVAQSLDELITTCPNEPREVRECPTIAG